jgi:hypothetical protein
MEPIVADIRRIALLFQTVTIAATSLGCGSGFGTLGSVPGQHALPHGKTENMISPSSEMPAMSCRPIAVIALIGAFAAAGCAGTLMGPTVQVMPGPNKPLGAFSSDQATCRRFAEQAVADQAQGANLRGLVAQH